jgi:hypothetical protein
MNEETFRSRLLKLVQKSRKALRLYSSMERRKSELADAQVQQWREVNADLLQSLSTVVDAPGNKGLAASVYAIRDRYYHEWRMSESELHRQHKVLISSAEAGDFLKVANLGAELTKQKARVQALQAVHHELQEVISRSHVSLPTIELTDPSEVETLPIRESASESPIQRQAKVIPLRKRAR